MCTAWREMREECRELGRKEGQEEGRFGALASLVRDGLLHLEEAAKRTSMTEAAFLERMKTVG